MKKQTQENIEEIKMEWKECECPICEGQAKWKELGPPTHRKYECDECSEFSIKNFVLSEYPVLADKIKNNRSSISQYIRNFSQKHKETLEIVLHSKLVEKEYQITIDKIIENL